ncbi:hypothetical protein FNU79_15590 [Deinococcus detaillensis]|uniref:Uncharacterized protein n=1 Tax=Deinococcus detaillensis TaxID=2592048 RepID=A0A553ULS9_9DEIO|nr:hypothetical protein [Deinococcus detaillensis]TSA81154.1 hypothetical protein FNU79_15590 [Deinococcus detaillensis]
MKKPAVALLTLLALSAAQALTLQGSVVGGAGLPPSARLGLWSVQPSGAAGSELSSTAITGGSFILTWPDEPPPSRAQFPLRPEAIGWPGVIGDVQLSAPVQSAATNLFVYNDANGNGKRDDNEALFDAFPEAQREPLITVWVSGAVTIKAGRGFSATLKSGWNTFLVDLGRSAAVSSYSGQPISVRVQR